MISSASKENVTVSVVMATYNGVRYLPEQLDSIEQQTRKPDELVILDDCSTDSTWEFLQEYASSREWVRLHRNTSNKGPNFTFMRALQLAEKELIFCSDQDDIWDLSKIELFLDAWVGQDLLYSNGRIIDQDGKIINQSEFDFLGCNPVSEVDPWYFYRANCVSGHSMMVTRRLLSQCVPIPSKVVYDQWIALVTSLHGVLGFVDAVTCSHRMHGTNTCNNPEIRVKKRRRDDGLSKSQWHLQKRKTDLEYLLRIKEIGCGDEVFSEYVDAMIEHYSGRGSPYFNFRLFLILYRSREKITEHKHSYMKKMRQIQNISYGKKMLWLIS